MQTAKKGETIKKILILNFAIGNFHFAVLKNIPIQLAR